MIVERMLALLLIAMMPVGALCCGMEAVATGDSTAPGRPTAGDGGVAALGKGDAAAAADPTTNVGIGVDSGSGAGDAGGLAVCRQSGAACAVTADCCAGLSCTGEDDDRKCN